MKSYKLHSLVNFLISSCVVLLVGIDPANVLITIAENHDIDWSFRDGVAQFVV